MRKLYSLVLVVALVFALSVNAFAAVDFTNSYYYGIAYLLPSDDGDTLLGVVDTKSLTVEQVAFMRDFFSVMVGASSSDNFYYCFFLPNRSIATSKLVFVSSPNRLNVSTKSSTRT